MGDIIKLCTVQGKAATPGTTERPTSTDRENHALYQEQQLADKIADQRKASGIQDDALPPALEAYLKLTMG